MKLIKIFSLAGLISLSGFLSAQNATFSDWDTDRDGKIEKYEFTTTFIDKYSADWDNTDDTGLDDEDFYTSTYTIVDADGDNLLTRDEWDFGYNYYYGDYTYDDYLLYDMNNDGFISYNEYRDALYDTDYFLDWDVDRDSYLSEHELAEAVFNNWDINDNGVLSKSEYSMFDTHYLDI